jgi:hypothetical protein
MQVESVNQFQIKLFKQVLEMMKQLDYQIIQQTQNVNQAKKNLRKIKTVASLSTHKN